MANGAVGGYAFDNFNVDGSERVSRNYPFGRFAAIDSIVAEGQWRMALKKKEDDEMEAPPPPPVVKPKYNPTFDSSRIGSEPGTSPAEKPEYATECTRHFSPEERYDMT